MWTHKSQNAGPNRGRIAVPKWGRISAPFIFPFLSYRAAQNGARYVAPFWARVSHPKIRCLWPRVSHRPGPWLLTRGPCRRLLWLHVRPPIDHPPMNPIHCFDCHLLGSCGQEELGYITVRCSSSPRKIGEKGEAELDTLICKTRCDVPNLN